MKRNLRKKVTFTLKSLISLALVENFNYMFFCENIFYLKPYIYCFIDLLLFNCVIIDELILFSDLGVFEYFKMPMGIKTARGVQ
jgi:hypothetical protein